jgi:hypothetical protein
VWDRVRRGGWDVCVAEDDQGVVLGVVHGETLEADPGTPVEKAIQPSPVTVRRNLRGQLGPAPGRPGPNVADEFRRFATSDPVRSGVQVPVSPGMFCRVLVLEIQGAARSVGQLEGTKIPAEFKARGVGC